MYWTPFSVLLTETVVVRADQLRGALVDDPARPAIMQRTEVADTLQPEQSDRRPRHAVLSGIPVTNSTNTDAQELCTRLAVQEAAVS